MKHTFSAPVIIFAFVLFLLAAAKVSANWSDYHDLAPVSADARPAVSSTLVISQAYGGGGGNTGTYLNDYVELKNISNAAQSLNGLSLYYGSATGNFASSATNAFALPDVALAPGRYYLVQVGPTGTGGAPLPVAPDVTTTGLNLSASNGKVALVTSAFLPNTCGALATPCTLPNAAIIDLVAWGTANNAEGGAATNGGASTTSTQGNVRKQGGCQDTDNSSNGAFVALQFGANGDRPTQAAFRY